MNSIGGNPEAVAVLAPHGRDAPVIAGLLRDDGMTAEVCPDLPSLPAALGRCGLAIVTDEAVRTADISHLVGMVEGQPDWSDYPFILLTLRGGGAERNPSALRHMRALGNVTFLERPFHPMTLVSLARTALASRRRQYQARDRLLALEASRAEMLRGEERLNFALAAGKLGAWELDVPTMTLTASSLCKSNYGIPAEAEFTYATLVETIHPGDRDRMQAAVRASIETGADYDMTYRVVTTSGETRWVEVRGRATGAGPDRMAGVSLDVTDRRQAEERQQLLIRELHHRVKNTLSTVQAIVGSTARGATSIDEFYRDFTGRLQSLANTHTILTEELWQRASLHELLGKELDLYDDGRKRVRVEGPALELPSEYAVPLGMAFHELATNAAKYGALSNGDGRISVRWTVGDSETGPRVRLDWIEEDGPPVKPPTRQGFGTRLLQRVLTAQVKADVGVEYDPAGVRVSLAFGLPDPRADEPTRRWG